MAYRSIVPLLLTGCSRRNARHTPHPDGKEDAEAQGAYESHRRLSAVQAWKRYGTPDAVYKQ